MRTIEEIIASALGSFKETTKAYDLQKVAMRCNMDFIYFNEHVLGEKLSDFHKRPFPRVTFERFAMVEWPRGHLKSTIFSINYPTWRLWRERNKNLATASSALDQSQKTIGFVQRKIEDNEFLKHLVPDDRNAAWNKSELTTTNGNNYAMKPFSDTARGMHLDYLILDDILRSENITQEQIKDIFWSVFFPTVQTRKGQLILAGTPMTTKDLFTDLKVSSEAAQENEFKWKIYHEAAVIIDGQGKWLRPLWPENFNIDGLQQIKDSMGPLRWEREYMCNPLAAGSSLFTNILVGKHKELMKSRPGHTYYLGIDVSMAEGKASDFTVFSILEKDDKGNLLQVKQERYHGKDKRPGNLTMEKFVLKRAIELNSAFGFKKVLIESIGVSKGLSMVMTDYKLCPPLAPVTEAYGTNKTGKEDLVSALQVAFGSGMLEILDNSILISELNSFKLKEDERTGKRTYEGVGAHDDCVMALALATYAAQEPVGTASIGWVDF